MSSKNFFPGPAGYPGGEGVRLQRLTQFLQWFFGFGHKSKAIQKARVELLMDFAWFCFFIGVWMRRSASTTSFNCYSYWIFCCKCGASGKRWAWKRPATKFKKPTPFIELGLAGAAVAKPGAAVAKQSKGKNQQPATKLWKLFEINEAWQVMHLWPSLHVAKQRQSRAMNFEQSKDICFFLAPGVFQSRVSQEMRARWVWAKEAEALRVDVYKNEYI